MHEYAHLVTEHPEWEDEPFESAFAKDYGPVSTVADLFRQISYDERTAAALIGLPKWRLAELRRKGEIEHGHAEGDRVVYTRAHLLRFIERRTRGGAK